MTGFSLPALRSLGKLADVRPTIIVDTREQCPLEFKRLPFVRGSLQSGDYSIAGCEHLFAVERKSIPDLVASTCSSERERFERELHRLRGFRFARLLICGPRSDIEAHTYLSSASPKSVLNTIAAFEARYNVPTVFCANPTAAAEQVESWCYWFCREVVEAANDLLRGHQALDRAQNDTGSTGTAGKAVPGATHGPSIDTAKKPLTGREHQNLMRNFKAAVRETARAQQAANHLVTINGHPFGGFQESDLKFLRLLRLAAARAENEDVECGGWLEKYYLQGDDKDHDLEDLRKELGTYAHPDLNEQERTTLIKSSPKRDGTVRLAVLPQNIHFDPSLADLQLIGGLQTADGKGKRRKTPGVEKLKQNLAKGKLVAEKLLKDCRAHGVP